MHRQSYAHMERCAAPFIRMPAQGFESCKSGHAVVNASLAGLSKAAGNPCDTLLLSIEIQFFMKKKHFENFCLRWIWQESPMFDSIMETTTAPPCHPAGKSNCDGVTNSDPSKAKSLYSSIY